MKRRVSGAQSTRNAGAAEGKRACPQPGRATQPESEALRWEKLRWEVFLGLYCQEGVKEDERDKRASMRNLEDTSSWCHWTPGWESKVLGSSPGSASNSPKSSRLPHSSGSVSPISATRPFPNQSSSSPN